MRNKRRIKIIIIILGIVFALLPISNFNIIHVQRENDGTIENRDETKLKNLKKSGGYSESFIHIDGSIPDNWSDTESLYNWCYIDNGIYIIENVTIDASSSPTGSGIFIENSKNVHFIVRNCIVYNAGNVIGDGGIKLEDTNNGILINNNCSNNGGSGIYLWEYCDNNIISGNTANNNGYHGIYLWEYCDNNIISGNTANNNSGIGINLYYSGISGCNNNTISGNIVNNNQEGIGVFIGDNNIISGNTATRNINKGIAFYNGENNIISGNTVKYNWGGINFYYSCDKNIISGNTINHNLHGGIVLTGDVASEGCNNNTISGNTIEGNECGIVIEESQDNLIYLNNFMWNGDHAGGYHAGNNQWDDGYTGNNWDDYSGSDSFPIDGIGDVPYNVFGGVYDTKPLMYPTFEDTDSDGLNNLEEYSLGDDGYRTNPIDPDTDDDLFNDGDEAAYKTNPLDPLWYPMPNLKVSHFFAFFLSNETSFTLDFSITNNGIWKAQGVIIIVRCEDLDLTFFNNTNSPLTLDVDETEYIAVSCPPIGQIGTFTLNVTVDPDNTIAETYSSKDGSARIDAENDNFQTADLTILPKTLNLAMISHVFSINEFNISFFIYDDTGQYIDSATIQIWWNGTDVSTDIINLGGGLYFISLESITVAPGEDPILLKMVISTSGYEDKAFETYIAVDPDTLDKDLGKSPPEVPLLIFIIAIISIAGGIGVAGITIFLLRKRKRFNVSN